MAFCSNCGSLLAEGARFCRSCGAPIKTNTVVEEPSLDVTVSINVALIGPKDGCTKVEVFFQHLDKTIAVDVPNSVSVGHKIQLLGLGYTAPDGKKGNAYLHVEHITYKLQGENNKLFCQNCGREMPADARFCLECGARMDGQAVVEKESQRKTVYDGTIHKCPHCGEVLPSFLSSCPACGHEIRDIKSSTAVSELAIKLERIAAKKMPAFQEQRSVMKMVFGKDFDETNEAEEAQERFEEQKTQEKADVIVNFSVPNTKEDILEFMILAASNIDIKRGVDDVVTKAWISKLEQVYQRAQMIMENTPDFAIIKKIYEQKRSELKSRKFKGLAIAAFIVGGYMLLMAFAFFMAETPTASIVFVLVGITLLIAGVKSISVYMQKNKHNL